MALVLLFHISKESDFMKQQNSMFVVAAAVVMAMTMALIGSGCKNDKNRMGPPGAGNMGGDFGGHYGDSGGGDDGKAQLLSHVDADLASAKGFLIAPAGAESSSSSGSSVRVSASEKVEESVKAADSLKSDASSDDQAVYLIDINGSSVEMTVAQSNNNKIRPLKIFNTKKYLIVNFDRWAAKRLAHGDLICSLVMMRKTDGAMFCADSELHCDQRWEKCDDDTVQTDASGDIIYTLQNGTVQKLDMRDPSNLSVSMVFQNGSEGWVSELAVNASGDALIAFSTNNGQRYMRAYNKQGGLNNLGYGWNFRTCLVAGQDADEDKFFYVDTGAGAVVQVDKSGSKFTQSVYYSYWAQNKSMGGFDCKAGSSSIARVKNHIYVRSTMFGILVDLINPNRVPKEISLPQITDLKKLKGAGTEVLLEGNNNKGDSVLLSFDSVGASFVTLVPAGEYVISAMGISSNGTVSFSGQRFSDGARVVAEIAPGSKEIRITSMDFGQVSQIIQIF